MPSAVLCVAALTAPSALHLSRALPSGNAQNVFAHPHTHHMSSHARAAEQTSPLPEPTSTRRTRDKVVLPSAPHSLARDAIPKIFLVARARDSHPQCPLFALSFALFRQDFSTPPLARRTHPRASEHGAEQRIRYDVGLARMRAVRSSGLLLFLSAGVGLDLGTAPAASTRLRPE